MSCFIVLGFSQYDLQLTASSHWDGDFFVWKELDPHNDYLKIDPCTIPQCAVILHRIVLQQLERTILLIKHWSSIQIFHCCSKPQKIQQLGQRPTGRAKHGVAFCAAPYPCLGLVRLWDPLPCVYWHVLKHGLQTGAWCMRHILSRASCAIYKILYKLYKLLEIKPS